MSQPSITSRLIGADLDRILQCACGALSVPAGEAVMVGDTPETDVRGAQRVGLRAVWLNRGHRDWPGNLARPDAVIEELGQLLDFVRQPG